MTLSVGLLTVLRPVGRTAGRAFATSKANGGSFAGIPRSAEPPSKSTLFAQPSTESAPTKTNPAATAFGLDESPSSSNHFNSFSESSFAPETPRVDVPPKPTGNLNEFKPKICIIGVGGAGGNAVNNMIARELKGVEFLVCNTDAQHLSMSKAQNTIQLGRATTQGLGCGANPDAGKAAAMESQDEIMAFIEGSHMVFITAGMGGGTGTGAAPVIAEACLEAGILTAAVVTKPFKFEGKHRTRLAEEGIAFMERVTDTLIVIPNQNVFQLIDEGTSLADSFRLADDVLLAGVRSVTDLMVTPGLINLDFADVQAVMKGMGSAMMGSGEASGEDRAIKAAELALQNPLLGNLSVASAKGMLVNITGGANLSLYDVDKAATRITEEVEDENANIIFGSALDESMHESLRVSIVATGIEDPVY